MTKRREHIRRALVRSGPRTLAVTLASVGLITVSAILNECLALVTVTDTAGENHLMLTAVKDPETLVELADKELNPNDSALYSRQSDETAQLSIVRAFPVEILADGREYVVEVSTGTVADALEQAGIPMDEDDFTAPALDASVEEGMEPILVRRVAYEDTVTQEPIPFDTQYVEQVDDADGRYTHHILQQEGRDGVRSVTTRTTWVDGKLSGSEVVATRVVEEPVDEVYLTLQTDVVSPLTAPDGITVEDGVPSSYSTVYTMRATGYSSSGGRGASGLGLFYGSFAVDPTLIPYGTKVYIISTDGSFVYGWAIATDTGAFIHSNRMQVDLFYETYAESVENGVKEVYVYVP